jgi:hypothetical protein
VFWRVMTETSASPFDERYARVEKERLLGLGSEADGGMRISRVAAEARDKDGRIMLSFISGEVLSFGMMMI